MRFGVICGLSDKMMVDLNAYLEKPCRFRLRSGREVFGVIWADRESEQLRFASSRDFSLLQLGKAAARHISWHILSRDEVVGAELLDEVSGQAS